MRKTSRAKWPLEQTIALVLLWLEGKIFQNCGLACPGVYMLGIYGKLQ